MRFRLDPRRPELVLGAAVLALFLYGAWLRVYGLAGFPLSNDELWRALWMSSDKPLIGDATATAISAPGYLLAGRWLSHLSNTEWCLKLTSVVPGVLSIPLAALIGWRVTRRVAPPLLLGLFITLNPQLIEYSRELKPYALEVFGHLLLLWLFTRAWHTRSAREVYWLNAVAIVSPAFALAMVFALPAVFGMSWVLLRDAGRPAQLRLGAIQLAGGLLFALLYAFNWRYAPVTDIRAGFFFENFFDASRDRNYLFWLAARLKDIAVFSFGLANARALHGAGLLVWLVLPAVIAVLLIRARQLDWQLAGYAGAVFAAVVAVNAMGRFPFGALRMDLFLIPYTIVLGALLYGVLSPLRSRALRAAALLAFAAPWLGGFHPLRAGDIERFNPSQEDLPAAMRSVCDERLLEGSTVVLYGATYGSFKYYTEYHDEFSRACGAAIRRLAKVVLVQPLVREAPPPAPEHQTLAQVEKGGNRIIVLFAHEDRKELQAVEDFFRGKRVLAAQYIASPGEYALVYDPR